MRELNTNNSIEYDKIDLYALEEEQKRLNIERSENNNFNKDLEKGLVTEKLMLEGLSELDKLWGASNRLKATDRLQASEINLFSRLMDNLKGYYSKRIRPSYLFKIDLEYQQNEPVINLYLNDSTLETIDLDKEQARHEKVLKELMGGHPFRSKYVLKYIPRLIPTIFGDDEPSIEKTLIEETDVDEVFSFMNEFHKFDLINKLAWAWVKRFKTKEEQLRLLSSVMNHIYFPGENRSNSDSLYGAQKKLSDNIQSFQRRQKVYKELNEGLKERAQMFTDIRKRYTEHEETIFGYKVNVKTFKEEVKPHKIIESWLFWHDTEAR